MDTPLSPSELAAAEQDLGLDDAATLQLVDELKSAELAHASRRLIALREENLHLRQQLLTLQADSQRLQAQLHEVATLIGSTRPHKLIHDLRNVLNELVLLRSVVDEGC